MHYSVSRASKKFLLDKALVVGFPKPTCIQIYVSWGTLPGTGHDIFSMIFNCIQYCFVLVPDFEVCGGGDVMELNIFWNFPHCNILSFCIRSEVKR